MRLDGAVVYESSISSGLPNPVEYLKHPLIFELEIKGVRQDLLLGLSDFGSL